MATPFGGSTDGLTALQTLVRTANRSVLKVMEGVTQEHADWLPPGTSNPIGSTYLHIAMGLDMNISTMLEEQPRIWEREHWAEKFGLPADAQLVSFDKLAIDLPLAREYHARVMQQINAYFDRMTETDLARVVPSWRGTVTVADALSLFMAFHTLQHLGEISAVKGYQGLKGFLF